MSGPRILLIVGGGIAAYKACELVRLIRKAEGDVTCVLTQGGAQFVTPMTLAALSENPVHSTLWDLTAEVEIGHIQLSRAADLVVVCPASADLLAKMAAGIADDLATTLLLATDKPVLAVPAMNVRMWEHAATQRNVATLADRGVAVLDPDEGAMACGEYGAGRLPEPPAVWAAIAQLLGIETPLVADVTDDAGGAFSSLSDAAIARTTPRRVPLEDLDEAAFEDAGFSEQPPEEPAPVIDLAAVPLLAKKGKGKAAPPTDPEALNHLVSGQAEPEPVESEGSARASTGSARPDLGSEINTDPAQPEPAEGHTPTPAEPPAPGPLTGKHVLITAGPTHEPIDPVRYIANRSSGRQGFAIAAAAAEAGARVTLVSGPVSLPTPPGVKRIDVETAREMADAVKRALPADVGIMVAAVADWRASEPLGSKLKKRGSAPPALRLTENPDILATTAGSGKKPALLIGFAAETEDVIAHAKEKRTRKGADWIVANDVSGDVMGGETNTIHIVTKAGVESLAEMPKDDVARALVERIAAALAAKPADAHAR